MKYNAAFNGTSLDIDIQEETSSFSTGELSGEFEFTQDNGRYFLRRGTNLHKIDNVKFDGSEIEFSMDGSWYKVAVKDEQELLLDKLGFKTGNAAAEGSLKSPMPGKILDIMVKEGDEVTKGQPVAILEAMKMENELKSPIDGVVKKIEAEVGQSVEKKTPILEIE
jgi:pyruvate carboxylase subunit B